MDPELLYNVEFPTVGSHRRGDIVHAHRVAGDQKGIDYLLRIGAIKENKKAQEERILSDGPTAFERAIKEKDTEIADLHGEIRILHERLDPIEAEIKVKDAKIKLQEDAGASRDLTVKAQGAEIDRLKALISKQASEVLNLKAKLETPPTPAAPADPKAP